MIDMIRFNYASLVAIVFLFLFISTNNVFRKSIRRWFLVSILLLLADIIVSNIETVLVNEEMNITLISLVKAVEMSLRPSVILAMIMIVQKGKKNKLLLFSIDALNMILMFGGLFSEAVFSFNENYEFKCGSIGYFSYALCVLYLAWFLVTTIFYYQERNCCEGLVIFLIVGFCVMATLMEAILYIDGLLHITAAVSITFFYLYFHTQSYKRDTLTGVLNRRTFFMDVQNSHHSVDALIAIDLNGLKKINDEKGHSEGDKAIKITVNCIRREILSGCTLYRMGGDEFIIVCTSQKAEALANMIKRINSRMATTPYSVALGIVEYNSRISIDANLSKADAAMYRDKCAKKGSTYAAGSVMAS